MNHPLQADTGVEGGVLNVGDSPLDNLETDAVHPRLAHHGRRKPASVHVTVCYQCYDCDTSYLSLTQLLRHSPWHGSERCLKCSEPITVYFQTSPQLGESDAILRQPVRLHTCRRSQLHHQNSDLHFLATHVSQTLGWLHEKDPSVILCQVPGCPLTDFPLTMEGVEAFLLHSDKELHNISAYCRKCAMPEFLIVSSDNSTCCTVHICTKDFKPLVKVIPDEPLVIPS